METRSSPSHGLRAPPDMRTTTSRHARAHTPAALLMGLLLATPSSAQESGAPDDPPSPPVVENTSAMDPEVVALLGERIAAVEAAPGDAKAWEDLGLAYEANTIWSLAEEAYSGLLGINGGDAQWVYRRGVVRFKIGDLEGALADLANAANTYKNTPVVQAWHADLLRMMGELEAAEAGWRQAIKAEEKQDPRIEWPQSRVGLAMTLLDLERPAEAEELCRRALELNPGYAHAAFILGRALRDLDRTEEAEVAFARAGEAFPSFPPDPHQTRLDDAARGFSRRMMVIENLIQAQNLPEAKRRIAAVLAEFPERHQVINTAARLALREGDVIRARELLGQSLTLAPQDPATLLEACVLELTEADSFSQQMMRLQQMAAAGQTINPDQLEQLRSKASTPAEKAVEYATSAAQAAPLVGRYSFWLGMSQRSLALLSTDGQAQQQLMQQAMASMQRASRLGCTEPSFHQQIASMYATTGNGRMMLLHAKEHLKRNPTDPAALQFTIQALLSNQRQDEVRPLADRLGSAAAERGDLAALQFTIQALLTVGELDAAEKALAPFENTGAGNPAVAQFAAAVRQHIQTQRATAEPAGPPAPPAGGGGS